MGRITYLLNYDLSEAIKLFGGVETSSREFFRKNHQQDPGSTKAWEIRGRLDKLTEKQARSIDEAIDGYQKQILDGKVEAMHFNADGYNGMASTSDLPHIDHVLMSLGFYGGYTDDNQYLWQDLTPIVLGHISWARRIRGYYESSSSLISGSRAGMPQWLVEFENMPENVAAVIITPDDASRGVGERLATRRTTRPRLRMWGAEKSFLIESAEFEEDPNPDGV